MYRGVIVPLVTPMTAEGQVCGDSVARLVASVRPAASGLIPALSSGEGWRLTETQWQDMVQLTARFAGGLPVLAGIELPTTRETIARARLAKQLGAAAVVVPPPFGGDLPAGQIRAHYQAIAREVDLPLFLYNEPKLTGTLLGLELLVELCRSGAVVGVKDSSGSAELTRALVAARTGVPVFQGWEHLCQATTPGVDGYILPLANLEPVLCRAMLEAPSPVLQAEIDRHCAAHDLLGEQWYLGLKRELKQRGVLADDHPVVRPVA
jgi:4-hydroxy-tetrahydrodipicolinate synthase